MNIDPTCAAFLEAQFSELPDTDDAPDPMREFLADAALAGAIGSRGHQHVAALAEETADVDKRAAQIMGRFGKAPEHEEVNPDEEQLAKAATVDSRARRLMGLRTWLRKSLAHGETVAGLVKHAKQYDNDEAALILEAAQGL